MPPNGVGTSFCGNQSEAFPPKVNYIKKIYKKPRILINIQGNRPDVGDIGKHFQVKKRTRELTWPSLLQVSQKNGNPCPTTRKILRDLKIEKKMSKLTNHE
jgi:hypothetical protein